MKSIEVRISHGVLNKVDDILWPSIRQLSPQQAFDVSNNLGELKSAIIGALLNEVNTNSYLHKSVMSY